MTDNRPQKLVDLLPDNADQLRARDTDPIQTLDQYFDQLYNEAGQSISWYYRNKKTPSFWARIVRWAAIVLSVAGGLYPIWSGILGVKAGDLGYALLATAAALIAVDRFGGLSSAWMRYITTAQALTREQRTFLLDWREARTALAAMAAKPPAFEQLKPLFKLLRDFAIRHDDIIDAETRTWISEFRSVLAELGRAPKKEDEAPKPLSQVQTDTEAARAQAAQAAKAAAARAAASGADPTMPIGKAAENGGGAQEGGGDASTTVRIDPNGTAAGDGAGETTK